MAKKIQAKLDELEQLSNEFAQDEEMDLEVAVDKYEVAAKLLKEVKSDLNKLELKIKEIKEKYDED